MGRAWDNKRQVGDTLGIDLGQQRGIYGTKKGQSWDKKGRTWDTKRTLLGQKRERLGTPLKTFIFCQYFFMLLIFSKKSRNLLPPLILCVPFSSSFLSSNPFDRFLTFTKFSTVVLFSALRSIDKITFWICGSVYLYLRSSSILSYVILLFFPIPNHRFINLRGLSARLGDTTFYNT